MLAGWDAEQRPGGKTHDTPQLTAVHCTCLASSTGPHYAHGGINSKHATFTSILRSYLQTSLCLPLPNVKTSFNTGYPIATLPRWKHEAPPCLLKTGTLALVGQHTTPTFTTQTPHAGSVWHVRTFPTGATPPTRPRRHAVNGGLR